jgi:molybdopterin-containing oxidoreductase family membrane subunit
MIAISEVKGVMPEADPHFGEDHGDEHGGHGHPHHEPAAAEAE